jgi:hypothetical protein
MTTTKGSFRMTKGEGPLEEVDDLPDRAQSLPQRFEVYYVFLVIFQKRSQGSFVATLHIAPP